MASHVVISSIAFRGEIGLAEAAASDALDVKAGRELGRKIVKHVCRVVPAC